jgi:hypothetical protein
MRDGLGFTTLASTPPRRALSEAEQTAAHPALSTKLTPARSKSTGSPSALS